MNKIILLLFIMVFQGSVGFSADTSHELDGIDLLPAVEYYQKMIHPLKQSVNVYHWNASGASRGDGPEVFNLIKNNADTFWSMYGDPQTASGGMYGRGLYSAADPIYSYGFGGGPENWFLLEMQLPVGFRLLDIAAESAWDLNSNKKLSPEALQKLEARFHCPDLSKVDNLFSNGGHALDVECQKFARKVFKDILKIDGFAYWYGQTQFKDCNQDNYTSGNRAIVITQNTWMTPENIRYFTRKSTHHLESRIRIETLFYKKIDALVKLSDGSLAAIADYLQSHETKELYTSRSVCSDTTCTIVVRFCDSQNQCDELSLEPLPRPSGPNFSELSAKATEPGRLLWPDLDGKPKDDNISEWANKQIFGCNGQLPYQSETETEAKISDPKQ